MNFPLCAAPLEMYFSRRRFQSLFQWLLIENHAGIGQQAYEGMEVTNPEG